MSSYSISIYFRERALKSGRELITLKNTVPIACVVFARPEYTQNLLSNLENLKKRDINFYIDGMQHKSSKYYFDNLQVITFIRRYAKTSKHNVKIFSSKKNLGCNRNTIGAMKSMCEFFDYFVILEEDIEFRFEYFDFLDKNMKNFKNKKIDNICGHNVDYNCDLSHIRKNQQIEFKLTKMMSSCWGMCVSKNAVELFLQTLKFHKKIDWEIVFFNFSNNLGTNLFERRRIRKYWLGKYEIASRTWDKTHLKYQPNKETGWDTWWQFSAMVSDQYFLTPTYSLARERIGQHKNSWHTQSYDISKLKSWANIGYKLRVKSTFSHDDKMIFQNYGRFPFKKSFIQILRAKFKLDSTC